MKESLYFMFFELGEICLINNEKDKNCCKYYFCTVSLIKNKSKFSIEGNIDCKNWKGLILWLWH